MLSFINKIVDILTGTDKRLNALDGENQTTCLLFGRGNFVGMKVPPFGKVVQWTKVVSQSNPLPFVTLVVIKKA